MAKAFADSWIPSWELEKKYPAHDFTTWADGKFKTGRARLRWEAYMDGELVSSRQAMELVSKKGSTYIMVSRLEKDTFQGLDEALGNKS
jgi:hypothetical protein